jgi:hypothetical protein
MTQNKLSFEDYEQLMASRHQEAGQLQAENEIAVLTRLVALFCKAPICLISLVHKGQVLIRNPYGMDECDIEGH